MCPGKRAVLGVVPHQNVVPSLTVLNLCFRVWGRRHESWRVQVGCSSRIRVVRDLFGLVALTYVTSEAVTLAATSETFGRAPLPVIWVLPRCGMLVEDPRHGEAVTTAGYQRPRRRTLLHDVIEPTWTGPNWVAGRMTMTMVRFGYLRRPQAVEQQHDTNTSETIK